MTAEIAEMYAQLTPENRRNVDAKINELLEQETMALASAAAQDARERLPEYFDQEVINEIAEAVKKGADR